MSELTLEDHIGDIVRKGRVSAGITEAAAASAAGLTTVELAAFEHSGAAPRSPNWDALGHLVGMDPARLERIAGGWTPQQPDLSAWRELRRVVTVGGGMAVNSYLVWDAASLDAALFDTGFDAASALKLVEENGLALRHVFITHMHRDHVGGVEEIRRQRPFVHIHSNSPLAPSSHRNRTGEHIHLGSLRISHRDTPGHSEDGAVYIVENWPGGAPDAAFVGDALFAGSMGRGMQSWELSKRSVREQILTLPPDTLLAPGHGPFTTVAQELANNPFA